MTRSAITAQDPATDRAWGARLRAAADRIRAPLLGGGDRHVDRLNALLAFGVRVTSAAILFVSQIALARWMGAEQFGIYVYAWTLVLVLGAIATLGLNIGAIRIVSELRERQAESSLRGFLVGSRAAVALSAFLLMVLAVGGAWLIESRGLSGLWMTIAVIMLAIPAYSLTDLQDGICRGCGRMASALLAPYILRPLFILGGIGTLFLTGSTLDATHAAIVAVAATWAAWAIQTLIVARDLKSVVPVGPRTYETRAWTTTSAPLMVMGIFDLAMQNIDVIMISNLLSPTDAGIYFAGAKTMALILFVHYAVGSAMSNRFAAIATRGDPQAMAGAVRDAVRWTFWPSVALAAIMLGLGHHLLALFGPKFVAGYPVMCILAVAIVGRAAIGPAESLLNMTGGQHDCARSLMIAAGTNLTLNLILTPRYGIVGAAVAVSIAILLGAFLNWRAARRNLGIDIGIWAVSRKG
jgi:O-antigen/teichoic acid export membrane protein